ncbi:hypothetical protein [Hydrogenivirga sp. 128-5-R1-1]|uniref:hypothetical protein n=1 Tax=Hydrogenivirga sp. 128-5-R1-1 TaxID=392423 RepID=UPI00015EF765|nr:hypothetical protein [Hydrogenivirga sp. 128-5-R1-1]EDP75716.1 hypothetical protein HG1285_17170 [Hydrogenivirga sp. 128-5-R1-1]
MVKRALGAVLLTYSLASAHLKPVPHEHIGLLHTEDILMAGVLLAVVGLSAFVGLRLVKRKA